MNVDLGVKGKNGSRFLEPRIDSFFFSICLERVKSVFNVACVSVNNLGEKALELFDMIKVVLLFNKDR